MNARSKTIIGLAALGLLLMAGLVYQGIAPVQASGEAITPFLMPTNPFPSTTDNADGSVYHTVASGETLVAIAQTYDVDLQELLALNQLDDKDIIHPGDILLIRKASAEGIASATAQALATSNPGMAAYPAAGLPSLPGMVGMVQGTPVVYVEGTAMVDVQGTLVPEISGTPVAALVQMATVTGTAESPAGTPTIRALLPDTLGTPSARAERNLFQRVFTGSSKFLGLGVLGLVLVGLFLVVVSTRRMRP